MQFSELMAVISTYAIRLQREDDDLVILGDDEALDDALWDNLLRHKGQLLDLVAQNGGDWLSPAYRITPDMLPLVQLDQASIDRIVAGVPGGAPNVQDIYPLAPLQEGMLYHYLSAQQGDPYVLQAQLAFSDRELFETYAKALQWVIDRHDILRTSMAWERLDEPVQVVWRQAQLVCEQVHFDAAHGDVLSQLRARCDVHRNRLDLRQAPLVRLVFAEDQAQGRVVAMLLHHHMVMDHTALEVVSRELQACLQGKTAELGPPVPFRNHLVQARMSHSEQEHEAFFREMLGDIDEPTLPFGLQDVQGNGQGIEQSRVTLDSELSQRLRTQARQLGVSAASLMHLAQALVLSKVSGCQSVVFGTVLLGRMDASAGSDQSLGIFINTLPLRVDVGEQGVRAGVKATHLRLTALLGHEQASLALAQRCSGVTAPTPLFSSMLNYRHTAAAEVADVIDVAPGIQVLAAEERTNYPLTVNVDDLGDDFSITVMVTASIGAPRVARYLQTALESLVLALEETPDVALHTLNILPAIERRHLLQTLNTYLGDYADSSLIHHQVEAQAAVRPEAVAVLFEHQTLSYRALNERANQVAHRLLALGVCPDDRVAICVERGLEMIIGLLGILKAGAGYVPIDPAYPAERIAYTLEDSAPVAVLVQPATAALVGQRAVPVIDLESHGLRDESSANPLVPGLTSASLAYVIYTSGSTGQPKGVMVEHRNVARLFSATRYWFDFNRQDVWALFHSFAFDFSVWEIWGALIHGGQLLVVPQWVSRSPDECYALLCEAGVSILNQTPSAFRQLIVAQGNSALKHSLRQVIFGGEALDPGILKPWYTRVSNAGTQLVNMYGITETTVHVTYRALEAADAQLTGVSPIGGRIPDLQLYVLDARREPVPAGVIGELYVGGAGVARGYLNRAELTAERFIADPFSGRADARLYKTGDLARWMPDGTLQYLGRNDDQVKIRGFRIELGEIESRLVACPGVREALVIAREDAPGDLRLVAYVIAGPDIELSAAGLRDHLLLSLAEYMVPSAFVLLDRFALTTNGKLDRKALPAPDTDAFARRGHEALQGDTESRIAAIWRDLLKLDQVGRHDNFFELGGHSLLAVKLIERMRQLELSADVRVLFGQPTLAALAAAVGGQHQVRVPANLIGADCTRITPDLLPLATLDQEAIDRIVATVPGGVANVQDIYALAPLQAGILYHHLSATEGDPYVLQVQFSFAGLKQIKAFVRALQGAIARHDILRTSVLWQGLDEAVQVVWRQAPLALERVDADPQDGDVLQQMQGIFDPRHYRLDFSKASLMRFAYTEDPRQSRWVGILLLHHLLLDHTALEVLVHELSASLTGQHDPQSAAVPYRNYVAQARLGISREEHEQFFSDMLGDIDEPTLPFGLQDVNGDGSGIEEAKSTLDASLSQRLRVQARQLGVSAASVAHLAWAQVLGQVTGREEVVFGTVLLGRMQGGEGADRALGMFINSLPLRVSVGSTGVREGVRATHARLSQLLGHEHASLSLAQRCSGVPASVPLFSSLLNYRHSVVDEDGANALGWEGIEILYSQERSNYPLVLSVDDLGKGFRLTVQTLAGVGAERIGAYMHTALEQLVQAMEQTPQRPLNQLSMLPALERDQVLRAFNATVAPYPSGHTVHGLFEVQAQLRPYALAVIQGAERLNYQQLNQRANQLAHHLLQQGVQPDDRVALCVRRGPDMLVGMLAILKAGAGYVPIDPAYPAERIAYLLQDSAPVAVLAHATTRDLLGNVAVVDLDGADWQQHSNVNPQAHGLTPSNLAYVIYTSGSTGLPKGVMVEHRTVENLVHWHCDAFHLGQDSQTSSVAGFGFDAVAWEVWPALCAGATLHLPPAHVGNENIDELLHWWRTQPLDVSFLPTPIAEYAFSQHLEHPTLRTLLIGGDRLRQFSRAQTFEVINNYGPTEATVVATSGRVEVGQVLHIGKPIANATVYLLDEQQRPVPIGVAGELYVGGAGVARGYLNRPDLTAERFLEDPFNPQARLYRTGDMARWLADGNIEYLGRNDDQVKVRGMRIEPGEIEAALASHHDVKEAVALVQDGRLVVWFTEHAPLDIEDLRSHLQGCLPAYMVPSAYVRLDNLPLTANGKLDRKALPAPDQASLLSREYEAPQGEVEVALAQIWADVLKVERVGRHDHFFELGGHSLLAVSLIERMRQRGLSADVRVLFSQPTLTALAAAVGSGREIEVPANRIPADCQRITPQMLSLVQLDQQTIDRVVASVPGGAANVQDIYPLAPLQEGILYHHISAEQGDPYLLQSHMAFDSLERLHTFSRALQQVIDRHDILRTAVLWQGLESPLQVVWRKAELVLQEVPNDPAAGDVLTQLQSRFDARHYRLDLTAAPLIRLVYAQDPANQRLVAIVLFHHLALDHTAMEVVGQEMHGFLFNPDVQPAAAVPYRNYVAQVRLGVSTEEHETFLRDMLGDIDEPTLPFGLQDVQGEGHDIEEAQLPVDATLARRVREQARQVGVSAASLMHLAWAQVLGQVTGREEVVFGTVLLGRMQAGDGADRALGMFINTLPLRVNVGSTGVREGVRATHARLSQLLGHEHASLSLAQRCSGVPASVPLFNSLLNYRHSAVDEGRHKPFDWEGIQVLDSQGRSNYPLVLNVNDLGEDFRFTLQTLPEVGARRVGAYMHTALEQLVKALEQAPQRALNQLSILPVHERERVLRSFNASAAHYPSGHTVHGLFEVQAQLRPDALAVIQGAERLNYQQLNQRANQLAHHLVQQGVQPDDRVALCVRRGPDMLVGMLAILKAGAGYVPIDPAYPPERLSYLLSDSAPVAVVTQQALLEQLPALDVPLINLDQPLWQALPHSNPHVPGLTPSNLAYVIYTSGSTGLPKGVMVEHRTVENLVHWHCDAFHLGQDSQTSSVAGFGFDAMAWEVWPALCAGATLHLPPAPVGNENIDELLDWWRAQPLDVSFLPTPVAEYAFSQHLDHPTLRTLLIGGDRLRQFSRAQTFEVINNYGPTEATVVATSGRVEVGQLLHIGKPIANATVYLLDDQQRPVPIGVAGELYVGGAGVARGYLNRPDLTAERFLEDPFNPQARLYRTGDMARWLADGNIEYLGRNDDQVKIRGMRIEPGEIEAALASHHDVKEAVALVQDGRLVVWFTEHAPLDIEDLRSHLQGRLPAYMVPSAYVRLDSLPLTANGKLDRKALPSPDQASLLNREYEAPQGEVEVALAQIWADVLKIERVGRHDHFFELGGHSLLAVSLIERMRQRGLSADVRILFSQPTLMALAAAVGSGREIEVPANRIPADCQRITPQMLSLVQLDQQTIDRVVASVPGGAANVQDIYPLAPLQEGILYHHITTRQGDPYLLQTQLAFDSLERLHAFAGALQKVIDRHDILRTGVIWEGLSQPLQVVWRHAELRSEPVPTLPLAGDVLSQLNARFDARHYRLDVTKAPLMQLMYAQDPARQRVVAVLLFHHIALDHTALDVVRDEILASLLGQREPLSEAIPYRNYVAQARLGVSEQEHEAFFHEMLADVDEPTLPFGLQDVQGDGNGVEEFRQALSDALSRRLRAQTRTLGVSAASLFHLAWAQVLAATSGKASVVFGTVLMGRMQGGAGADRALGMFINTLPLRVNVDEGGVRDAVRATHARLSQLLGHEHASLSLAQRCSGVAAPLPLFSAMLNYRHSSSETEPQAGWQGIETLASAERTNFPLTLSVDDLGEGFVLTARTVAQVGAQRIGDFMRTALESLVEALEQTPQMQLNRLPVLAALEREYLLTDLNATAVDYPLEQTIQSVFEAQVERTPDAVALVAGEQQLTYRELNERANQLAHHLRQQGVGPDARVVLCVERGLELVIGLWAILKAGGAYVPVDPGYPPERIAYMLQDCGPTAVLVHAATRALLKDVAVPVIDFDRNSWQANPLGNPQVPQLSASHMAYVIYTSGTTGTPKGVMVEHRGLNNLVFWSSQLCRHAPNGALLQKAPFSFDGSVWEFFWPLTTGMRLVLARPDGHREPEYLQQLVREQQVTVIKFVPAMLAQFLDVADVSQCSSLTDMVCGGGELTAELARRVQASLPNVRLHNVYGPTEATVDSSSWTLEPGAPVPDVQLPIGKPISNTRLYVLDANDLPVPVGVSGHLHIGGVGVARGYLGLAPLTAERFIDSPFVAGDRLYRTGDLVRYLPDGNLQFLGRNDFQVKLHGLRVELGEIEARLASHPALGEVAVLMRDERLVAYFTLRVASEAPGIEALREHLLSQLPAYMVPSAYVVLDALPLSPNGKLDRKALPAPGLTAVIVREYEAPVGDTEILMARLWAQLLNVERVGRHDNFFELGGHSLLAVSLVGQLNKEGMEADVRALFEQPTLSGYAAITERMEILL
ncbi:amino acid adenylation domain-containing protein [Pseudomonas sp. N3-W]|uniref:non-ribosomal peptide synthetase n=1 Tax=Pseudomonas sp. N3-W TaxID=2975049 RepID=UPI00217E0136|nr:non-ribosomal peptide synthetase [Pseudomonas sp. N3-W]UWF47459.1 amino acid adenylation domain-containing protein [Pseudomonas sp. N3-W]